MHGQTAHPSNKWSQAAQERLPNVHQDQGSVWAALPAQPFVLPNYSHLSGKPCTRHICCCAEEADVGKPVLCTTASLQQTMCNKPAQHQRKADSCQCSMAPNTLTAQQMAHPVPISLCLYFRCPSTAVELCTARLNFPKNTSFRLDVGSDVLMTRLDSVANGRPAVGHD